MNLTNKISTDILVNTGVTVATRLRGLIFIPVISGMLGIAAFGAYSQVLAIVTFLEVIVSLGLFAALVRYGQEEGQEIADLYYSLTALSMGCGIVGACLMTVFASELSKLTLGNAAYAGAYQAGSVLILTRVFLRMSQDYFRVDSRIKTYSIIQGIKAYGLVAAVVVAILVFETGLTGVFYSMVIVESITVIGTQYIIGREIGYSIPSFDRTIEYLRYSLPYAGSQLTTNISSRIDRVLVGYFLGASAVGVYSIAYQTATAILMYQQPLQVTFFPEFSRFIENDRHEECSQYLKQGARYFVLVSIPTVGGMYLIGPDVIQVLIRSETGGPSRILLATIAFGIAIQGIDGIYGVILTAGKRTVRLTGIRVVGALSNLLLNVALIPFLGVFGAAIATVGTYVLRALLVFYSAQGVADLEFATITGVRAVASTLFMIFVAEMYFSDSTVELVVSGAILYSVAIVFTGEISISEIRRTVEDLA